MQLMIAADEKGAGGQEMDQMVGKGVSSAGKISISKHKEEDGGSQGAWPDLVCWTVLYELYTD